MLNKVSKKMERTSIKPERKIPKKEIIEPVAEDVEENKVIEEESKKEKKHRSINLSPTLGSTYGLNIPVNKIKTLIATNVLNKDESDAINKIRRAQGREELVRMTNDKNGVEKPIIYKAIPRVPVAELDDNIQKVLQKAHLEFTASRREKYIKEVISGWKKSNKDKYARFIEFRDMNPELDDEKLIAQFDEDVYNNFNEVNEPREKDTEWGHAINLISKMRVRFSANSGVYLTAFLEYLIREIAVNGTYNSLKEGKKMIKFSNAIKPFNANGKEFHIFPMLVNLKCFNNVESEEELGYSFSYNHLFSISEIFREVKMECAKMEAPEDAEFNEDFMKANVSKELKSFCSNLIVEVVMRIGQMLMTEVEARNVKTVNDTIMKTIIHHFHTSAGVSFEATEKFIDERSKLFNNAPKKSKNT